MNENLIKGAITELKCQQHCIEHGLVISKPLLDNARYDLIIDLKGKLLKVQIKTSRWVDASHEAIVFNCKSTHAVSSGNKIMKYTADEVDYFMTEHEGQFYLVPCTGKTEQRLRLVPTKNGQDHRATFAKDYVFEEVIKKI